MRRLLSVPFAVGFAVRPAVRLAVCVLIALLVAACGQAVPPSDPASGPSSPPSTSAPSFFAGVPIEPTSFIPDSVAFTDDRRAVVVGASGEGDGLTAITEDGGRTWSYFDPGTGPVLDVEVTAEGLVWATIGCGDVVGDCPQMFVSSVDGGISWSAPTILRLRDPTPLDDGAGWALSSGAGADGANVMAHTTDGGVSWELKPSPCEEGWLLAHSVAFPEPERGWLLCTGEGAGSFMAKAVYETRDGGETWRLLAAAAAGADPVQVGHGLDATGHPSGLAAARDGSRLFMPMNRGWTMTSGDGGTSWVRIPLGQPEVNEIVSIAAIDRDRAWALLHHADRQGRILFVSDDGGANWEERYFWAYPAE